MNIGEAARQSGVSAKMIRYYEQTGLIEPPRRTASGYRVYDDSAVHVLRFIRRARDLGFSVEGIRELLSLWADSARPSREVRKLARAQLDHLDARIAELQQMRETLSHLVSCCAGDDRPDCPILADLEQGGADSGRTDPPICHAPRKFGPTG